jgi:hypothetical protein
MGHHNHPFLEPSAPADDPHMITAFLVSQQVPTSDPHGLVHTPLISGWVTPLILFVTTHP